MFGNKYYFCSKIICLWIVLHASTHPQLFKKPTTEWHPQWTKCSLWRTFHWRLSLGSISCLNSWANLTHKRPRSSRADVYRCSVSIASHSEISFVKACSLQWLLRVITSSKWLPTLGKNLSPNPCGAKWPHMVHITGMLDERQIGVHFGHLMHFAAAWYPIHISWRLVHTYSLKESQNYSHYTYNLIKYPESIFNAAKLGTFAGFFFFSFLLKSPEDSQNNCFY